MLRTERPTSSSSEPREPTNSDGKDSRINLYSNVLAHSNSPLARRNSFRFDRLLARLGRSGRLDVDLEAGPLEHERPTRGGWRPQYPLQDDRDIRRALFGDLLEHLAIVLAVDLRLGGQTSFEDQLDSRLASRSSIGTRSRGRTSAESGTATFSPGTRIVAFAIAIESPRPTVICMLKIQYINQS